MARFTIHAEEKRKHKKRVFAYFWVITGALCLLFYLFFDERDGFIRYAPLLIAVNGIWIGSDSFISMGKLRFVEINEQYVEWLIYDKNFPVIFIEWKDIRWIKKERDGSVTVFQDSSFSNNLSLVELTAEDRNEILRLFVQYSMTRQIRLVNFSDSALALV
ncbi:MAG: hypothetical protein ABI581_09010 [Sediminibacterium sp.]